MKNVVFLERVNELEELFHEFTIDVAIKDGASKRDFASMLLMMNEYVKFNLASEPELRLLYKKKLLER